MIHPAYSPETQTQPRAARPLVFDDENRLPYAPTPLAAWELMGPDKMPYHHRSLQKFEQLLSAHNSQPAWLTDLVGTALMGLHTLRCEQNFLALTRHVEYVRNLSQSMTREQEDLVYEAKVGAATIPDLLRLKYAGVGFHALELAKQSHPFRWETNDMDTAVNTALSAFDSRIEWRTRGANVRYTFHRLDNPHMPHGLLFSRKREVAMLNGAQRDKTVAVKRSGFVLRFDGELVTQEDVPAQIIKAGRFIVTHARSIDEVSQQLASVGAVIEHGIAERAPWLAPTATSYYVRDLHVPSHPGGYEAQSHGAVLDGFIAAS
jgi:hypothetical protein